MPSFSGFTLSFIALQDVLKKMADSHPPFPSLPLSLHPSSQATDSPEQAASRLLLGLPLLSEPLGLITLQDILAALLQEDIVEEHQQQYQQQQEKGGKEGEGEEAELLQLGGRNEKEGEVGEEGGEGGSRGGEAGVSVAMRNAPAFAAPLLASTPSLSTSISTSWGPHQLATAHTLFGRSVSATPMAAAAAGSERRRWRSVFGVNRNSHRAAGGEEKKKEEEEKRRKKGGGGPNAGDVGKGIEEGEAGVDEERSSSVELSTL